MSGTHYRVWLCVLLATAIGCDGDREVAIGEGAAAARAAATPSDSGEADVAGQRAHMIRADGIGDGRIGMTIGELRAALRPDMTVGTLAPYMVDIDALAVVQGNDTVYHVLIVAGEPSSDDAPIELLATSHRGVRTEDGVGPGDTLADAAAAWGEPRLSYNTNDESREWATFPALPPSIMVRVMPADDTAPFAGIYATQHEFNETDRYDPAARITMILVRRHAP
jgi:hypothetical protein